MKLEQKNINKFPTIFISYSWDSQEYIECVNIFVKELKKYNLKVIYDADIEPGDRITIFMEKAVSECDFVLYICTPNYKRKADNRKDGVGYENTIITGELFEKQNERKFILILFSGTWEESSPTWGKGKKGFYYKNAIEFKNEFDKWVKKVITNYNFENTITENEPPKDNLCDIEGFLHIWENKSPTHSAPTAPKGYFLIKIVTNTDMRMIYFLPSR